jgi:hypothetical protein
LPRTLKTLCLALGALLIADIAILVIEAFSVSEPDPSTKSVIVGVNLVAIAITSLLLALLIAFAKRVRKSIAWLKASSIVNAVVLSGGSLLFDHPLQGVSLLEALEIARVWSEVLVCFALALVLHRHESKSWFARSDL